MQKDLKIGMIIGVVLLIAATLVISLLSEGSLRSRLQGKFNKDTTTNFPEDNIKEEDKTPTGNSADTNHESTGKIHIVIEGQTIKDIAQKYYGNPRMINRIVDENPHIPDNFELKAGMKIKIPE